MPRHYSDGQLMAWLRGISGHNLIDGCCPDLSCCRHDMTTPLEEREHFVRSYLFGDMLDAERMELRFFARARATMKRE